MPLDYNRPAQGTPASPLRQIGLLILRLTTATTLLLTHGIGQSLAGWHHIWHKTPWSLPTQLTQLGFPAPTFCAIALLILSQLSAIFILLGLLTRLSSTLLAIIAALTALLYHAYPNVLEPALLYTGCSLALALSGPGSLALDRLLRADHQRRL